MMFYSLLLGFSHNMISLTQQEINYLFDQMDWTLDYREITNAWIRYRYGKYAEALSK